MSMGAAASWSLASTVPGPVAKPEYWSEQPLQCHALTTLQPDTSHSCCCSLHTHACFYPLVLRSNSNVMKCGLSSTTFIATQIALPNTTNQYDGNLSRTTSSEHGVGTVGEQCLRHTCWRRSTFCSIRTILQSSCNSCLLCRLGRLLCILEGPTNFVELFWRHQLLSSVFSSKLLETAYKLTIQQMHHPPCPGNMLVAKRKLQSLDGQVCGTKQCGMSEGYKSHFKPNQIQQHAVRTPCR